MAAPVLTIPAPYKPVAEPAPGSEAAWLSAASSETASAQTPLTSEPPLPDAEPLTSEPPLAETATLTSESEPVPDSFAPGQ
ncbi:hypothetical protein ACIQVT_05585 [Streptomyces sp. NPDC100445]|uniref:hypothetical protein n=1 Tax=Streptomyces sp. NPDC100445 TaxID=3366102 RepID=UPI00380968FC